MKNSKKCPKCGGSNIIPLEDGFATTRYIGVLKGPLSMAYIHRYLCGDCGFLESYIEDKDDLEKIKKYQQG